MGDGGAGPGEGRGDGGPGGGSGGTADGGGPGGEAAAPGDRGSGDAGDAGDCGTRAAPATPAPPPGTDHTTRAFSPASPAGTVPAPDAGDDGAGTPTAVFQLRGRTGVFDAVTDFVYLPRDAHAVVTTERGGRFALPGARCTRRLPARRGPAEEVGVELRGSGTCSRQVNNFAAAGAFEADRLIAVEVLTPGGNWSSYPPHKHDEERPGRESRLEEIYHFEIADAPDGTPGLGYHRVSPSGPGRRSDLLAEVRDGDTVLVPDGWHGPSVAAPGHDLYYLNVMAGPGEERAWLIQDHPDHAWIRTTWPDQPADPRLPLYHAPPAAGARAGDGDVPERPVEGDRP
ncbi:5-deoxy-glucuronate isomerase [Streptomyces sp. PLAI1-29]|uniref:5-deoxy-glucuronate isomerase n=1 Tax=Streptomyces zingiberis TaxID=2053010 RepID=A0ABX1BY09_9ACTN|nr:5-deoxy-glucuronate isomerase [Streptomyces zingiberis]NJQ02579.1 5-deoxy-glucuronate isomerase [Streptomyces zingiberis]